MRRMVTLSALPAALLPALIVALIAATIAGGPAAAHVASGLSIASPALGRPLGYARYRPDGARAGDPLPLLILLHGVQGSAADWIGDGGIAALLDRGIARGEIPPIEAVMPDAGTSWYVDSRAWGGPGDYGRAILQDLEPALARRDALRPGRAGRAIAGLSMGGFGALRFATLAPQHYCAVAALSPALWTHLADDSPVPQQATRIFAGSFGTPFEARRFRALSPMAALDQLALAPHPPVLFLAAGERDFDGILRDTRALAPRLAAQGLDVTLRLYPDGHDWQTWDAAMADFLPVLGRALRGCA